MRTLVLLTLVGLVTAGLARRSSSGEPAPGLPPPAIAHRAALVIPRVVPQVVPRVVPWVMIEPPAPHDLDLDDLVTPPPELAATPSLYGEIRDLASGDTIPGVTVIATGRDGAQTAITDEDGRYTIAPLPPGDYVVTLYYIETAIEHATTIDVGVPTELSDAIDTRAPAAAEPIVVHLDESIELGPDYVVNIPIERRTFESSVPEAADDEDVSFSSHCTLENTYVYE